jgi:membrane protein implicated in regulation of membrane protease activity
LVSPLSPLSPLSIPIAIPFGLPADTTGDPVFPVWVAAVYFAAFSSALIVLAAFVRRAVESRLQRRRALRDSRMA